MVAAMSRTETAALIGVVLLALVVVFGFVVGPKWWHWGSFIVLTIVLSIPLAMAFFIPLPIVVILNVAISHNVWLKKHGSAPVEL
jgi:cation transport ATPase